MQYIFTVSTSPVLLSCKNSVANKPEQRLCPNVCLCVYLKHPCCCTPHQCRGMDHAIPQNSQQQFMVHRIGTETEQRHALPF